MIYNLMYALCILYYQLAQSSLITNVQRLSQVRAQTIVTIVTIVTTVHNHSNHSNHMHIIQRKGKRQPLTTLICPTKPRTKHTN